MRIGREVSGSRSSKRAPRYETATETHDDVPLVVRTEVDHVRLEHGVDFYSTCERRNSRQPARSREAASAGERCTCDSLCAEFFVGEDLFARVETLNGFHPARLPLPLLHGAERLLVARVFVLFCFFVVIAAVDPVRALRELFVLGRRILHVGVLHGGSSGSIRDWLTVQVERDLRGARDWLYVGHLGCESGQLDRFSRRSGDRGCEVACRSGECSCLGRGFAVEVLVVE